MIRTFVTPQQQKISINLPEDFVGNEVEVIAFKVNEEMTHEDNSPTYFASEKSLAKEWLTPEEDKAWQDL